MSKSLLIFICFSVFLAGANAASISGFAYLTASTRPVQGIKEVPTQETYHPIQAHTAYSPSTFQDPRLEQLEKEMLTALESMTSAKTDDERAEAAIILHDLFVQSFDIDGVFDYPFRALFGVASTKSADGIFRLINYNVAFLDGSFRYYAFILMPDNDYTELLDKKAPSEIRASETLDAADWYGALYYEIHPVEVKRETYYTLMGWDGNSQSSTIKVLDVLTFDKKGKAKLGRPIFQTDEGFVNRRFFEYANDAQMTLRYLASKEAIIFNKLEPIKSGLKGQYAYYVPSTTYDGYRLSKEGLWELAENFDMTRPKSEESGAQFNFPDRVDFRKR